MQLTREGHVGERPVQITKGVTLEAGEQTLEIAYLLEGLPPGEPLHFGVEFNFAGLPAGLDDRYFHDASGKPLGQLGTQLDLADVDALGLVDEWLGIDVELQFDRPTHCGPSRSKRSASPKAASSWCTSRSSCMPHWFVTADRDGRWSVTMPLAIDTSAAEKRGRSIAEVDRHGVTVASGCPDLTNRCSGRVFASGSQACTYRSCHQSTSRSNPPPCSTDGQQRRARTAAPIRPRCSSTLASSSRCVGELSTMPATSSPSQYVLAVISVCSVALIVPSSLAATTTSG